MKKLKILLVFLLSYTLVNSQTFQPNLHTVTNKPIGLNAAAPVDARSYFYDQSTFTYRPYASRSEILSYLNLAKYRTGQFDIILDSASRRWVLWFRDGVTNADLIYRLTDTTGFNYISRTLQNGRILIGNGLNIADPVLISGAATLSNTGILTLSNTGVVPGAYMSANVTVGLDGRVTAIGNGGGASGWGLFGNAGTTEGVNFLGTTDDKPLSFRVNNIASGYIGNSSTLNTFFGHGTGVAITDGQANVMLGYQAGNSLETGSNNIGIGVFSLVANRSGNFNTAVGSSTMSGMDSGYANTAIGISALSQSTDTKFNTAIGTFAGYKLTGNYNIILTNDSTSNSPLIAASGNTVIGGNLTSLSPTLTNSVVIGNGRGTERLRFDGSGNFSITAQSSVSDTTTYKALVQDASGNIKKMSFWPGSGGSGSINLVTDIPTLSEIKIYSPAQGVSASSNVTNYAPSSVDSARYKFSTTPAGTGGSEYGGWLAASTSGDSIKVTAPFWVVFGDSQAEGHPNLHGRLHWLLSGVPQNSFKYDYPDSVGQLSYHLRQLTNMRWYNHGIGGQTSIDCRIRFYRDVLGLLSPNSTDGRGNQTLNRTPQGVVIIVGINDIFNGIPLDQLKQNLEWMASVCQENGVRCVMLNMPGDAISSQTELIKIATINEWLRSGVMDQYGVCLVDYNSWWNDPVYGNDNIHHTALIFDDIHPSKVGYDSLAHYIYRSAKLPVLRQAVFINELDPAGFTGYSRPAGITINSNAYTIATANDTIDISTFVPDSVWIKVTSSTNVTGTTFSGFSHIEWFSDNNPNNDTLYTRKTLYSGSQQSTINASQLTMIAPTLTNGYNMMDFYLGDMTSHALQFRTTAGGAQMILNGGGSSSVINGSVLSLYNSGGVGMATNGSVYSTGSSSQFGALEIRLDHSPDNTGFGISAANTASAIRFAANASPGKDLFRFDTWNGANIPLDNNPTTILSIINTGFGSSGANNQIGNLISLQPTYNQVSSNDGTSYRGIYYNPILISLTKTRHFANFQVSGNNYFNIVSDSTLFGFDSTVIPTAKVQINGTFRLDKVTLPPSTYSILVHGLTDSITYAIPSNTFATAQQISDSLNANTLILDNPNSGDTLGVPRNDSTFLIKSFLGNTGVTFTTTDTTVRINVNTLYTGDGTLSGTRQVSGAGQNLFLGTSGSKIGTLAVNTSGDAVVNSDDQIFLNGGLQYKNTVATDANFTVTSNMSIIYLPDITTDRDFIMPSNIIGQTWTVYNSNTTANVWNLSGVSTIYDPAGNLMTKLNNYTYYVIQQAYNGTTGSWRVVSKNGPDQTVTSSAGTLTLNIFVDDYEFSGSTTTWTLPQSSTFIGTRKFNLKNMGSGNITLNAGAGDNLYETSSVSTITIAPGASRIVFWTGTIWSVQG